MILKKDLASANEAAAQESTPPVCYYARDTIYCCHYQRQQLMILRQDLASAKEDTARKLQPDSETSFAVSADVARHSCCCLPLQTTASPAKVSYADDNSAG